MTSRTDAVLAMTEGERIVALVFLGQRHPAVFGEVLAEVELQRRIRAQREAGAGKENGDG